MIDEATVRESARQIRAVLDDIAEDGMTCTPALRHRLEGAELALESLASEPGGPLPE